MYFFSPIQSSQENLTLTGKIWLDYSINPSSLLVTLSWNVLINCSCILQEHIIYDIYDIYDTVHNVANLKKLDSEF